MLADYLMLVVYLQVLQQLSDFCQNSAAVSNKVSYFSRNIDLL